MVRLMCALILVLLITTPSLGQQSLVGTYKIISQEAVVDGTPTYPLGKAPHGYVVITPTRAIFFFTGENRKFGTSVAEKAALFDTLVGYTSTYRVEGSRIMFAVDASWVEFWNGKEMGRNWTLAGNRLTFIDDPRPFARDPSKMATVSTVWEKID